VAAVLFAKLFLLEQELGKTRNRRQRVVQLVRDAGDELADRGELLALHELCFQRLLLGDILDHHDDALLGRGARDVCHVHADRPFEPLRARDQRSGALAAARRGQEILQRMRLPEQRFAERRADDVLQRRVEELGKRAIRALHASFVVHHGDALAQRVERRLPLLLGAPHHLEEPGVRDDDGGVGRQGREQPDVFGDKDALAGVRDHERADHDSVRPQRDGRRGGGFEALRDHRGLGAGIPDQLEVLPRRGAGDQAGILRLDLQAAQRRERAFGGGDLERVARGFSHQRQERPPGIEKPHRVAHHLLDDAIQLQ